MQWSVLQQEMPEKLKGKVYKTVVRPEQRPWKQGKGKTEAMIDTNENRMLRRNKETNIFEKQQEYQKRSVQTIKEKRLKWQHTVKRVQMTNI